MDNERAEHTRFRLMHGMSLDELKAVAMLCGYRFERGLIEPDGTIEERMVAPDGHVVLTARKRANG